MSENKEEYKILKDFEESIIQEISIPELNAMPLKFAIPSYQRGYRWTTNEYDNKGNIKKKGEVETLLDDLLEFANAGEEWKQYCLQPIVLQRTEENLGTKYIVVDGQQRLTTLEIIIDSLSRIESNNQNNAIANLTQKWDILYDENVYLKKRLEYYREHPIPLPEELINDYFRRKALSAVDEWLKKNDGQRLLPLFIEPSASKEVKIIKYLLFDGKSTPKAEERKVGHEAFKRLNSAKIPLTSGELIKAMYMAPDNGLDDEQKMEIVKEWEIMENNLKSTYYQDMFCIHGSGLQKTQTKIELLFTIIAKLSRNEMQEARHDERLLFRKIDTMVHIEKKPLIDIWDDILKVYWWIESCYKDIEAYNLLCWIAEFRQVMPQTIYNDWWSGSNPQNNFKDFKRLLRSKINLIAIVIELFFPENASNAANAITLDNIMDYKEEMKKRNIYNSSINGLFKKYYLLLNIQSCINAGERLNFANYKRIKQKGYNGGHIGWDVEHIKPQCEVGNDSICNLVLLDASTNRDGKYCQFRTYSEKRLFIKERLEKKDYYMLPCTQKAMMKFYTTINGDVDQWDENIDGKDYFEILWSLMMDFLGKNKDIDALRTSNETLADKQ